MKWGKKKENKEEKEGVDGSKLLEDVPPEKPNIAIKGKTEIPTEKTLKLGMLGNAFDLIYYAVDKENTKLESLCWSLDLNNNKKLIIKVVDKSEEDKVPL